MIEKCMAQIFVKKIYLMRQLRILRSQLSNFKEEIAFLWMQYLCPHGHTSVPNQDLIYRL